MHDFRYPTFPVVGRTKIGFLKNRRGVEAANPKNIYQSVRLLSYPSTGCDLPTEMDRLGQLVLNKKKLFFPRSLAN